MVVLYTVDRRRAAEREERLTARIVALEKNRPGAQDRPVIEHRTVVVPRDPPVDGRGTDEIITAESDSEAQETPAQKEQRLKRHEFRTSEERAAAYEQEFRQGPTEPSWERQASKDILPEVEKACLPTSSLVSFECRAAFCRVELEHLNQLDGNAVYDQLFSMEKHGPLLESTGGVRCASPTPTQRQTWQQVCYIARRGVLLAPQGDPPPE
jgi:hypothetical protein